MSPMLLSARNLSKGFGPPARRVEVVRDLDLDVAAGSLTLIKGPSGCGKSTLLAMLAGLTRPDGGTINIEDVALWSLGTARRDAFRLARMGFVFQGSILLPALPAIEQVTFVLREAGLGATEARRRAAEALDHVGLSDRRHLRPAALSGGEKQRVAIAIALAKRPAIIFADEPTSALDTENTQTVARLLAAQARDLGTAVLCVTHDDRLLPYADRVLHMAQGRIESVQTHERNAA
ncbi:MAG: ABC transporter ATP-binding protein [Paracoccus sp. (in: a-proteobacteria)]|nr:ABC transporter ATP-binding protein [Paracoccus sp. (in: a-proteobacteria)]